MFLPQRPRRGRPWTLGRHELVDATLFDSRNGLPEFVRMTLGFVVQAVLRPFGAKGFVVLPRRWVVERTFGWLGRCRRHSKDDERNPASSEAMIYVAMIRLMPKRLELGEKPHLKTLPEWSTRGNLTCWASCGSRRISIHWVACPRSPDCR
jgi:hypothetical protein